MNHFRIFQECDPEPRLSELARTRQGVPSEQKHRLLLVEAPQSEVKSNWNNFAEVPVFQQRVIANDTIVAQVGPDVAPNTNHRL